MNPENSESLRLSLLGNIKSQIDEHAVEDAYSHDWPTSKDDRWFESDDFEMGYVSTEKLYNVRYIDQKGPALDWIEAMDCVRPDRIIYTLRFDENLAVHCAMEEVVFPAGLESNNVLIWDFIDEEGLELLGSFVSRIHFRVEREIVA